MKIDWAKVKEGFTIMDVLKEENKELKEEIERLKKREQECIDHYLVQCKYASEMEDKYITANNIINEFNKLIENEINESKSEDNYERVDSLEYCLATLRELKGVDKE